jgi:hypothetical protein
LGAVPTSQLAPVAHAPPVEFFHVKEVPPDVFPIVSVTRLLVVSLVKA